MKHLLTTLCAVFFTLTAAVAQEASSDKKPATEKPKAQSKDQKEADLMEAFKIAGVTLAEQEKVRAILAESTVYSKTLKADTSLSEDEMKAKLKEYSNTVKTPKLNEVLGKERSKEFRDAQKTLKEAFMVKQ
ncbi:hypothetical protein [Flavobacterium sp.]|uniref:hypothetical protein n=1 Tax=Flavobacterium sp. TaxID=239 RepID=UPI0038FC7DC5